MISLRSMRRHRGYMTEVLNLDEFRELSLKGLDRKVGLNGAPRKLVFTVHRSQWGRAKWEALAAR